MLVKLLANERPIRNSSREVIDLSYVALLVRLLGLNQRCESTSRSEWATASNLSREVADSTE
jgi:hypothetical protein